MRYSLLLKGGHLVDPAHARVGSFDIAVLGGQVVDVAPELSPGRADRVLDVAGSWVLPGVIDLHVHTSRRHGGQNAHRMLARAGVCTAVDMGGPFDEFLAFAVTEGAGLNLACLQQVRPGLTVKDEAPSREDLEELMDRLLAEGAIGFKLLGGHYLLTPAASRRVLEVANRAGVYVAFHAGSTVTGSNLAGFLEAVELSEGLCVHLPHVNSYCRGQILPRALDEIEKALSLLEEHRNLVSESYLATINGTSGRCVDGVPESMATRQCLSLAGYPPTEEGLEAAIRHGYARVNAPVGGENINITGPEGVSAWRWRQTVTSVNFPVNPPESRFLAAIRRDRAGRFVVDALASDGGAHPRNVNVSAGMALVHLEALTPEELVLKTSLAPAQLLGLPTKGHLGVGADADITGVDPASGTPRFTLVGGKLSFWQGAVVGSGSTLLTTQRGLACLQDQGIPCRALDLERSSLYRGRPENPFQLPG